MNVLILTPDAVGSTLLQRLLTIYMQFHDFDRPVINLHELTNGIEKYYSPEFNREIVSKRRVQNWGYYQTLDEVVGILDSVDHYKTSRLAQYHIKKRQDTIAQQVPFYRYLDQNFFVIACRRHNIFEHALSMSLSTITKKLNVYNHQEKIQTFIDLYADGLDIDERVFLQKLEEYRDYVAWSQDYFSVASYFYYDEHVDDLERFILNLPIFSSQKHRISWKHKFDIDFDDWNRLHHIPSDIGSLPTSRLTAIRDTNRDKNNRLLVYQQSAPLEWPAVHSDNDLDELPEDIRTSLANMMHQTLHRDLVASMDSNALQFLSQNRRGYDSACEAIARMQKLDILVSAPPIKKQTLQEKMRVIKNFDRCLAIYNQWIDQHADLGSVCTMEDVQQQIAKENNYWKAFKLLPDLRSSLLPIAQF